MNNLIKKDFFSKDGLLSLTATLENGEVLLDAEKVAKSLGLTEIKNNKEYVMWRRINQYLKPFGRCAENGNPPQMVEVKKGDFIPEPAVYKLAFKASNEVAERFQDWLAIEVIPSIRKYGTYSTEVKIQQKMFNAMKVEMTGLVDGLVADKINQIEEKCSKYFRPVSKEKQNICQYIKKRLGISKADEEYELVKQRVLIKLGGTKWEDIQVETLVNSLNVIDESIKIIKSDRTVNQLSIFEIACGE